MHVGRDEHEPSPSGTQSHRNWGHQKQSHASDPKPPVHGSQQWPHKNGSNVLLARCGEATGLALDQARAAADVAVPLAQQSVVAEPPAVEPANLRSANDDHAIAARDRPKHLNQQHSAGEPLLDAPAAAGSHRPQDRRHRDALIETNPPCRRHPPIVWRDVGDGVCRNEPAQLEPAPVDPKEAKVPGEMAASRSTGRDQAAG